MTANMTEESSTAPEQERTKSRKVMTQIEMNLNQAMIIEAGRAAIPVEMSTNQAKMRGTRRAINQTKITEQ